MKKVGEILKEERIRKDKTIEEISHLIKIRADFLKAIEEGDYTVLPGAVYIRGFVTSYAKALGLNPEEVLPFYRREQEDKPKQKIMDIPQPIDDRQFKITPQKIAFALVSIALTAFLVILFIQYRNFYGVPLLVVVFPTENLVTTQPAIDVLGKTDPRAIVTVNGEKVTPAIDGSFRVNFRLEEGLNRIKIISESEFGKRSSLERAVEKRNE